MKIGGLQKVSTIDYPGEICCIVFLWGCNFRCGFCYNSDLVVKNSEGAFSEEEVLEFLKGRVGKLDAVCISGGEPLVSLDFDFIRRIRELGFKIKLDTNGSFPERLKEMIDEGLVDYIAMDVKGAKEDYSRVTGVEVDVKKIEESIKIVNDFENSEFRTTVVPGFHDEASLVSMGEWIGEVCGGSSSEMTLVSPKPGRIFLQGFKPQTSMIDSKFMDKAEVSEKELLKLKGVLNELFGEVGVRC
mgnify:CR=1 FL=1|jgi:pyruvate formate lyase activating enzyme